MSKRRQDQRIESRLSKHALRNRSAIIVRDERQVGANECRKLLLQWLRNRQASERERDACVSRDSRVKGWWVELASDE